MIVPGRRGSRVRRPVRGLCGWVTGGARDTATPRACGRNIADTDIDLAEAQARHSFREDLYSR